MTKMWVWMWERCELDRGLAYPGYRRRGLLYSLSKWGREEIEGFSAERVITQSAALFERMINEESNKGRG